MEQSISFGDIEDLKKKGKIEVVFKKNRVFLNMDGFDSVELTIKDGFFFNFDLPTGLIDFDYKKKDKKIDKVLIKKDEIVTFKIHSFTFHVKLNEDLILVKDNTKYSRLQNVNCSVFKCTPAYSYNEKIQFTPESCVSLNQAYTFISSKYFTDRGTHTRKVWDTFKWEEQRLKEYRSF